MIRRSNVVAVDELDNVVALVHRLFDQRVTRERSNDVEAFDVALVLAREFRNGFGLRVRKHDAGGFDEVSRRHCAEPTDDAIGENLERTRRRFQVTRQALAVAGTDLLGLSLVQAAQARVRVAARREYRRQIAILRPAEFVASIDDVDVVLTRQRECVFDRRVARADDDDRFVAKGLGIVQVIFDARQFVALDSEASRIAFQTDRQARRTRRRWSHHSPT